MSPYENFLEDSISSALIRITPVSEKFLLQHKDKVLCIRDPPNFRIVFNIFTKDRENITRLWSAGDYVVNTRLLAASPSGAPGTLVAASLPVVTLTFFRSLVSNQSNLST